MKITSPVQLWSAVPTPLTAKLAVDQASVENMITAAIQEGIQGVFLAGTCGEGPWLSDRERKRLVNIVAKTAAGRIKIAVQVSDNSVPRILDNIEAIASAGVDYAIIAPPAMFMNATPQRISAFFEKAAAASPLPVGIYDLGRHRAITIPEDRLMELYLLPNVHLVKDSSGSPSRRAIALAARAKKSGLTLLNGDEFACLDYLMAGYDGCMFGGAAAVAPSLHEIVTLYKRGRNDQAAAVEAQMKETLWGIYGGRNIACWLTGLKYYMQRRGLFASTASFLEYPLTQECRDFIDQYVNAGMVPISPP